MKKQVTNTIILEQLYVNDTFLLAKLEKVEPATPKSGGETAKLVTLTKAIDAIQENSKSLETMGMYHYQKQIYAKLLSQSRR